MKLENLAVGALLAFLITAGIVFASGCGGDDKEDPLTWGDAAEVMVTSWCTKADECDFLNGGAERCIRHSMVHLCELDETCENEVDEQAGWDALSCAQAIDELEVSQCFGFSFGWLPPVCDDFWKWQPDASERIAPPDNLAPPEMLELLEVLEPSPGF